MICVAVSKSLAKKLLNHHHYELHGREIIIQHQNLEHLGRLNPLGQPLQNDSTTIVLFRSDLGCCARFRRNFGCHGVIL